MLKNKSHLFVIIILLTCLIILGWFTYSKYINTSGVSTESPAFVSLTDPTGTAYTDIEGNPVDLSAYLGKVLVINVWASWSPATVTDLQTLSTISKNYSPSEVVFLAINRGEPKETASAFLRTYNVSTEVMLVLDSNDVFYDSVKGYSMPETIIYDKSGNIHQHQRGNLNQPKLTTAIDDLVN